MNRDERNRQHGLECCKVANRAFGYREGLRLALERLGAEDVDAILDLARDRRIPELLQALPPRPRP